MWCWKLFWLMSCVQNSILHCTNELKGARCWSRTLAHGVFLLKQQAVCGVDVSPYFSAGYSLLFWVFSVLRPVLCLILPVPATIVQIKHDQSSESAHAVHSKHFGLSHTLSGRSPRRPLGSHSPDALTCQPGGAGDQTTAWYWAWFVGGVRRRELNEFISQSQCFQCAEGGSIFTMTNAQSLSLKSAGSTTLTGPLHASSQ